MKKGDSEESPFSLGIIEVGYSPRSPAIAAIATSTAATPTITTAATSTTAATAAAAAEAATTTTAAAATEAAATAAATEATATFTTRASFFGLVDAECAPVEVLSVHSLDGLTCLVFGTHRHEAEAARLSRHAIGRDVCVDDLAELGEDLSKGVDSGVEGQVAHVDPSAHAVSLVHCDLPGRRLVHRPVASVEPKSHEPCVEVGGPTATRIHNPNPHTERGRVEPGNVP
jgi:hypothetical protein